MVAPLDRLLIALAALAGVLGVALSAAAAHLPAGPALDVPARFLLLHAAVLLGLAALIASERVSVGATRLAAATLVLGLALFCGDLTLRAVKGVAPLPMAAPIGGVLQMLGWALVGVAALWPRRARADL
jgi:uncharacterized membrane protein YgdD (TMEM256/DUF423 family)